MFTAKIHRLSPHFDRASVCPSYVQPSKSVSWIKIGRAHGCAWLGLRRGDGTGPNSGGASWAGGGAARHRLWRRPLQLFVCSPLH